MSAPALQVEKFSFAHPDLGVGASASVGAGAGASIDRELLHGVSFCLEQGSFTLLVGATGSGKTTLLRSIKPELAPKGRRSGSIKVFGTEVSDLSLAQSATMIGYVSQDPDNQIVCDTVWHELAFGLENLAVPPEEMRRRVAEIAYFFGIEPWMHTSTASLSGGQKQALTLASILVMQPKLLLLDEPTAQLDPIAEKNFLHALFRVNRELGITIVVATHAPETLASYATGALRLTDGHIEPATISEFIFAEEERGQERGQERDDLETDSPGTPESPGNDLSSGAGSKPVLLNTNLPAAVTVRDIFFRYAKDTPWVLRGLDLVVAPSTIHAIIGGNGSGKSTLLHMIASTLKPERGSIKNTLAKTQAFLPQNPKALFVCDTVEEELKEWQQRCGYTDEDVLASVTFFGLAAAVKQHPYDLSGGEQQKLALAKLLLTKPQLLLLDEPTKGLDASSKCALATTLLRLRDEGVTMIMATHDLAFVSQLADTATMIFDGQTACTEPTADFFDNNIFYRPKTDGFLRCWHDRRHNRLEKEAS